MKSKNTACADCILQPKPYTLTLAPLLYSHPVDHLIHQFKAHTPQFITQQLAPLLQPLINESYKDDSYPDMLIPVPLHWLSKFKRGFNQAHCLADFLSAMTNIPCQTIARQTRRRHNQKSLNRKHRLANLTSSFVCDIDLTGQHVVVIDDVITTCSTAINMTEALLRANAKRVDVWAFARTPKKDKPRSTEVYKGYSSPAIPT